MQHKLLITLLSLIVISLVANFASAQNIVTTPQTVTATQTALFTFNSGFLNLTVATYNWNWGDNTDNTTTTTPNANHAYTEPGTYTITITVTTPLNVGEDWNVSSDDWAQTTVGIYTSPITVQPSTPQNIGNNLINNLALFAILPVVIAASVFFIALKGINGQSEQSINEFIPALIIAIIIFVMTELCVYIATFVVSALS